MSPATSATTATATGEARVRPTGTDPTGARGVLR